MPKTVVMLCQDVVKDWRVPHPAFQPMSVEFHKSRSPSTRSFLFLETTTNEIGKMHRKYLNYHKENTFRSRESYVKFISVESWESEVSSRMTHTWVDYVVCVIYMNRKWVCFNERVNFASNLAIPTFFKCKYLSDIIVFYKYEYIFTYLEILNLNYLQKNFFDFFPQMHLKSTRG